MSSELELIYKSSQKPWLKKNTTSDIENWTPFKTLTPKFKISREFHAQQGERKVCG